MGSAEAADLPCGGFLTLSDHAELLFLRRFFLMDVQLLVMLLGGAGDSSQRFVLFLQGGPPGRGTLFVDIKLKVPP